MIEHYEVPPEIGLTKAFAKCKVHRIRQQKLKVRLQIPGSHARSFTTTVAEMKASIQITSTRPMLSVIVGLFDPQTIVITFSSATPYTFTSQFSSKEARYSNLYSFSVFQLRGHPSDVTLDLVVTSRVGETLAPMQLRASSVTKIGAPNPKPDHCQHKPDCLNPNGGLLTQVHKL